MIDVTEVLNDPDFVSLFYVFRTAGKWVRGRFVTDPPVKLKYIHPAQPSTEDEIQQIPEGDRTSEMMTFFCVRPKQFYITREGGISDEVHFKGNRYKIVKVKDWNSHGWMRAFGALIGPVLPEEGTPNG